MMELSQDLISRLYEMTRSRRQLLFQAMELHPKLVARTITNGDLSEAQITQQLDSEKRFILETYGIREQDFHELNHFVETHAAPGKSCYKQFQQRYTQ